MLTQQVSHYHAARYRAAAREFGELRVLSLMNSADFDEFLNSARPDSLRWRRPRLAGFDFFSAPQGTGEATELVEAVFWKP